MVLSRRSKIRDETAILQTELEEMKLLKADESIISDLEDKIEGARDVCSRTLENIRNDERVQRESFRHRDIRSHPKQGWRLNFRDLGFRDLIQTARTDLANISRKGGFIEKDIQQMRNKAERVVNFINAVEAQDQVRSSKVTSRAFRKLFGKKINLEEYEKNKITATLRTLDTAKRLVTEAFDLIASSIDKLLFVSQYSGRVPNDTMQRELQYSGVMGYLAGTIAKLTQAYGLLNIVYNIIRQFKRYLHQFEAESKISMKFEKRIEKTWRLASGQVLLDYGKFGDSPFQLARLPR